MRIIPSYIRRNFEEPLVRNIEGACKRLESRFSAIDMATTGISEYNRVYLARKFTTLHYIFEQYAFLLALAASGTSKPVKEIILVDYGGGSGLLSLLAREMGIGTVIYSDIYETSCEDVRKLGGHLGLLPDHIVAGDIDRLHEYLQANSLAIDVLMSFDVIEHIYDVERFIEKTVALPNSGLHVIHGTGTNSRNPFYVRRIKAVQHRAERTEKEKTAGWKEGATRQSFLEARKDIIQAYAPELSQTETAELASLTRGLIRADICSAVDEYKTKGSISYRPDHPTNTCDPFTGSWVEHLMDVDWLRGLMVKNGLQVRILNGFWNSRGRGLAYVIKYVLNVSIRLGKSRALFVSPYFILDGTPE